VATNGTAYTKSAPGQSSNPEKPTLIDHMEQKKIAQRAYFYWEARGRPWGSPNEDWFRAEREVKKQRSW
jgi:hypothetical protein